jgi:hypothetical protein
MAAMRRRRRLPAAVCDLTSRRSTNVLDTTHLSWMAAAALMGLLGTALSRATAQALARRIGAPGR